MLPTGMSNAADMYVYFCVCVCVSICESPVSRKCVWLQTYDPSIVKASWGHVKEPQPVASARVPLRGAQYIHTARMLLTEPDCTLSAEEGLTAGTLEMSRRS